MKLKIPPKITAIRLDSLGFILKSKKYAVKIKIPVEIVPPSADPKSSRALYFIYIMQINLCEEKMKK
jgi:hypothetical protein